MSKKPVTSAVCIGGPCDGEVILDARNPDGVGTWLRAWNTDEGLHVYTRGFTLNGDPAWRYEGLKPHTWTPNQVVVRPPVALVRDADGKRLRQKEPA